MKTRAFAAVFVCTVLVACQSASRPGAKPEPAPAPVVESWVKTELYFGLAPAEAEGLGLAAAEGTWRSFLDEEATPRFPDGLTVFDAYGQSRTDEKTEIDRIRSRVLVIVHPATPAKRAGIRALCEAYKSRTGAKSVLVVETPIAAPLF